MTEKRTHNRTILPFDPSAMGDNESPYSDIELKKIGGALGIPKNKGDWLLHIQGAAIEFVQINTPYKERKAASEVRDEARKAAKQIEEVMGFWSLLALERREVGGDNFKAKDINLTLRMLESLRKGFVAVDESWEGRRVPKNPPREFFVARLISIWKMAHGKKATRGTSSDSDNRFERGGIPYGPFYSFAVTCFEPIDSKKGLDDIIKKLQ